MNSPFSLIILSFNFDLDWRKSLRTRHKRLSGGLQSRTESKQMVIVTDKLSICLIFSVRDEIPQSGLIIQLSSRKYSYKKIYVWFCNVYFREEFRDKLQRIRTFDLNVSGVSIYFFPPGQSRGKIDLKVHRSKCLLSRETSLWARDEFILSFSSTRS